MPSPALSALQLRRSIRVFTKGSRKRTRLVTSIVLLFSLIVLILPPRAVASVIDSVVVNSNIGLFSTLEALPSWLMSVWTVKRSGQDRGCRSARALPALAHEYHERKSRTRRASLHCESTQRKSRLNPDRQCGSRQSR